MNHKNKKFVAYDAKSLHQVTQVGLALAEHPKQWTAFQSLAARFALYGITLRHSDWRRGPVRYYAFRAGQRPELCSLTHLGLILSVMGGHHA